MSSPETKLKAIATSRILGFIRLIFACIPNNYQLRLSKFLETPLLLEMS
jgi:hypothetical protein